MQGKLDLVRVIGVLLHEIKGLPSSHYECVPHKRVGVALQTTVETLYVNHGIDLNNFVWLLLCDHQHRKKQPAVLLPLLRITLEKIPNFQVGSNLVMHWTL